MDRRLICVCVHFHSSCSSFNHVLYRVGPQQFSLTNVVIQDGGLGCEQVADDAYAGSVVLLERGECDFVLKVSYSIHQGATPS